MFIMKEYVIAGKQMSVDESLIQYLSNYFIVGRPRLQNVNDGIFLHVTAEEYYNPATLHQLNIILNVFYDIIIKEVNVQWCHQFRVR